LNYHIGPLIGLSSLLWSGHIVHKAIPVSRGVIQYSSAYLTSHIQQIYSGDYSSLALSSDSDNHVWLSNLGSGSSILTFNSGLKPDSSSLYLTDIAHHHLAIGVLLIIGSHLYSSLYYGYGNNIRNLASSNGNSNVIRFLYRSINLNLALALISLSFACSLVAQHTYSLLPFVFLSYTTIVSLYVHHQYIASLLMFGGLYHLSIFLVRDYSINTTSISTSSSSSSTTPVTDEPLYIVLKTKFQIISHLSWVSLFLGFHTLLIYVHNDTVVAFGDPDKQLLLEPLIALNFQRISSNVVIGLGPGDFIVHHAFAFGIHTCVLILIKGSLDCRSSKIMPDKVNLSNSFACDGPTRGGTCDISSWDSAYLALFWVLNTDGWLMFYFHWKHLTLFENTVFQFDESSIYLDGWFRDYLWFNSASLINGYTPFRANDISCWAWIFLGAHLCWATGFMFLISWRGYWQELLEIITVQHLKTPLLYDIWHSSLYSPVALSIVQARLIGLTHFAVGFIFTYASFVQG